MKNSTMEGDLCTKRFTWRRKWLVTLLLALIAAGWYFTGDSINEIIDRYLVRHFHYEEGQTKLTEVFRRDDFRTLYLQDGSCVKLGEGVICYSRSMGHHTLFGLRKGYGYVNVNGRVYWRGKGECRSTLHVTFDNEGFSNLEQVSETRLVDALRKQGFTKLP